ncbi:MAG: HigA family addiction module antitoxin [Bryobacteraceae bacterium]
MRRGRLAFPVILRIRSTAACEDEKPAHPARSIRVACLQPLGRFATEAAKLLAAARQTLNTVIVNSKSGASPEMAIRQTKAFGGTPRIWLRMQTVYDLSAARKGEAKSECAIGASRKNYAYTDFLHFKLCY